MAAQDQGLTGFEGDADEAVRQQFGNSVCDRWLNRAALAGSTQWRAMADVILAADYLKQGPVVQEVFEELLVACWANAGVDDGEGGAQRVRAVLAMIHKLGTSHQGVRNALSQQLALRTDSLTSCSFTSTHRALLFMALAVGTEARPVAEKLVRQAVRTTCTRPGGIQLVGRESVICALSGRSFTRRVLLPPTLRDELSSLVARLTFNVPFDLVEQGAGHYAEWGGVSINSSYSNALDRGGPSATAIVNFLVEYVGVEISFTSKMFGSPAETKGFVDAVCDLANRGKGVELYLTLDRSDRLDSDSKTLACQKLLEHGLRALTVDISTVRGPDGVNSFVSNILRSATTKTMLVHVRATSRSYWHLGGKPPCAVDFRLHRRNGMLEVSRKGADFERVERYVVVGIHRVDMSGMMDE